MSKIWIDINKNPDAVQKYWFAIHSENNKLAHSEMYANKADCIQTAKLIVAHAKDAVLYDETGAIQSNNIRDKMIQ